MDNLATSDWQIVYILIGIFIILIILTIIFGRRRSQRYWWYWWRDHPRKCWNKGWIFDVTKWIFWGLNKFSLSNLIAYLIPERRRKWKYVAVDSYIAIWLVAEVYLLLSLIFPCCPSPHNFVIVGLLIWRLADLFIVWGLHFVISESWNPISVDRTLILVFVGYLEITISYAILAFILREHFTVIDGWEKSIEYSIRNAITMGFTDYIAEDSISYSLFYSQLMFVLLFITSVVSRIIGRR